jgi:malonate decarboxylase holo-[acyl-carrier-protein] synthase
MESNSIERKLLSKEGGILEAPDFSRGALVIEELGWPEPLSPMPWRRHDLVRLTQAGRGRLTRELGELGVPPALLAKMFWPERVDISPSELSHPLALPRPLPGIVRRWDRTPVEGVIPVGLSFGAGADGQKRRWAAFAAVGEVEEAIRPQMVLESFGGRATTRGGVPAFEALSRIRALLEARPLAPGVWGSVALEMETGYALATAASDLDLTLDATGPVAKDELRNCLEALSLIEDELGVRVDPELLVDGRFGISLKELFSEGGTVLGKGLFSVALLNKKDVFSTLARDPGERGAPLHSAEGQPPLERAALGEEM